MTEPAVNNGASPVETGTRMRKICLEPMRITSSLSFSVQFEHLILKFSPLSGIDYSTQVSISTGQPGQPVSLSSISEAWEVNVLMLVKSTPIFRQRILQQTYFSLSHKQSSTILPWDLFMGHRVQLEFEFRTIEGLGSIVSPLRDYSVADKFADVTIIVEGKKFELNKMFLATRSSFFEKLLLGDFAERNQSEIELKDVSAEDFTELLDFLALPIHQLHAKKAVSGLLRLADQFDVPEVVGRVENMMLTSSRLNFFDKGEQLWMAEKYGMKLLQMRVLSDWKHEYSRMLTRKMYDDLSRDTVFNLLTRYS